MMLNDCGWLSAHHAHHHAHLFKLRDSAPRPDLCQITGWKLWPSDWPSTWDMLRYCYSMSFEASINGAIHGNPWNHREDSCLRNTVIPKSRQPEFSSKADFEIHPVFSICSPPLTHLPHLPKASEHLQDFGRFRCRHSAACFRFNLQQLPTAWVCGSIFSLISPFPEVVRIPHLPLTSGNLLLKHCQVPAFEATSCNFSQAEPSWVENWYIVVLYLVGTRAKEIKRVFSSQTTCWI